MMNKQELKGALSKIHASEDLIKEVLAMKIEKKFVKSGGRFVRAAVIAAVVTALLATTAFAAPLIFNALISGRTGDGESFLTPTGPEGSQQGQSHSVYVDVQMNEDAPASIEKFYMPVLDSGYEQYFGFVYKDKTSAIYSWTQGQKNWEDEIRFEQISGGMYDPKKAYCSAATELGGKPEAKMVQLMGIQGYLVEDASLYGTRHFLWSDGDYLFHLEVPNEYADEDIAKVLLSLAEVKDILPYCVSMEPEHIEAVFG